MRRNRIILASFSTLLLCSVAQASPLSPISPRDYYAKLGNNTDATSLLDFFDIYQEELNSCVDPDVFYNATLDLAKLGYEENYREIIAKIQKCPNMDEPLKDAIKTRLHDFDAEQESLLSSYSQKEISSSESRVIVSEKINEPALLSQKESEKEVKTKETEAPIKARKKLKAFLPQRFPCHPLIEPAKASRCALPVVKDVVPASPVVVQKTEENKITFNVLEKTRNRNGDKGTSKLFSEKTIFSAETKNMEIGLVREHLSAGNLAHGGFFGTYYNYTTSGEVKHKQTTKQNVLTPYVKYKNDQFNFTLGTTPFNAQIGATPTFDANYKFLDNFTFSAYHRSMEDSVLSKVGMKDIYSDLEWGRVLESGSKLAYDLNFGDGYFFNTDMSYNVYSGKNVHKNYSMKYHATLGKYHNGLSYGAYSALEHYNENQDNYTFGHGGYYSPQLLAGVYPFVSYRIENDKQKFTIDTSVGTFYEKKNMVATYLKGKAFGPVHSSYEAESGWDLAYNLGMEYERNLGNDFKFLAGGRYMGATSDYNEWIFNLGIRKSF